MKKRDIRSAKSTLPDCGCSRRQFIAAAVILGGGYQLMAVDNFPEQSTKKANLPVRIPHAQIRMKSPNSELFGITPDGIIEITYAEVLAAKPLPFHF